MKHQFSLALLIAISDWQRGGDDEQVQRRGAALKQACTCLPSQFKRVPSACFRQIALVKGGVWALLGESSLPEKISSWTLDLALAKTFKGGVPPVAQGFQGVIFERAPAQSEVVVNLWSLLRDPEFQSALKTHAGSIPGYHDGIGKYGNNQSEIVLEIDVVNQKDIHSLGGHSSSFEDLVFQTAVELYGETPSSDQLLDLKSRIKELEPISGARWLDRESTHRVLARVEAPAVSLREIKRRQQE